MIHDVNDSLAWGDVFSVLEAAERFDAVLNVGREVQDHPLPGIEYKMRYFDDDDPFPCDDIWECVLWIDEMIGKGKKVYVHCHQGNSRSASTVIAYLHHKGMCFEEACERIVEIKPRCTHSGVWVDAPLPIRPWFVRDWPEFVARRSR